MGPEQFRREDARSLPAVVSSAPAGVADGLASQATQRSCTAGRRCRHGALNFLVFTTKKKQAKRILQSVLFTPVCLRHQDTDRQKRKTSEAFSAFPCRAFGTGALCMWRCLQQ